MAKLKTKLSVLDTRCEEISEGIWAFKTEDNIRWIYKANVFSGLNLFQVKGVPPDSVVQVGTLYAKTLDLAVMYAWGHRQGWIDAEHLVAPETDLLKRALARITHLGPMNDPVANAIREALGESRVE